MRRCQDELVGRRKDMRNMSSGWKRGQLRIPRVSKRNDTNDVSDEEVLGRCREIAQVFSTVERMLREDNLGSFGHMITGAFELLKDPAILPSRLRQHTRFILVDEFQDANFAQVKILQMLAGDERNVFAVGDPDQAIYRFRGASSAAFVLFQRHFPGAGLVKLEKNRRSTTSILQSAFALIAENPAVVGRAGMAPAARSPLISARDEDQARAGRPVPNIPAEAVLVGSYEAECSDLVSTIVLKRRAARCRWADFAVLYRLHSHRDLVASELAKRGIPFSIESMDVTDMPQVRDLLASLGAVVSANDDGASLFRVAALPQFSIDPEKLRAGMQALPRDLTSAVRSCFGSCPDGRRRGRARSSRAGARRNPGRQSQGAAGAGDPAPPLWLRRRRSAAAGGDRLCCRVGGESHHPDRRAERAARISQLFPRSRGRHCSFFQ